MKWKRGRKIKKFKGSFFEFFLHSQHPIAKNPQLFFFFFLFD